MSSTSSSQNSATGDDVVDSKTTVVTNADIEEIENLLPPCKRIVSRHELRVKKAAQDLLQHSSGIISTIFLTKSIERDAANLLVEECLLLFTDDLFEDRDYVDPEGYIKYVPDALDIIFIGRLVAYNIDPTLYLNNITLPEVWKARLSVNGIRILRTMGIYRNILDSTPSLELPCNREPQNSIQSDQEETVPIQRSSYNIESLISSNSKLHQYHYAVDISNFDSNNFENELDNSNNKRVISTIDDSNNATLENKPSRKICRPRNDNDCLIMQYHCTSVLTNMPIMNWNLLRKQMIGLTNKDSTTCYINAALQCLASTPPLVDWLFDQFDKLSTCQLANQGKFCSICEVTKVICSIHPSSRNKIVELSRFNIPSADSIRTHVHLISPLLTIGHQEDVSEFLIYLFDHCVTCLSSHLSMPSVLSSTPTIIDQIFTIKLLSSLQCPSCLYTSDKEEPHTILYAAINNLNHLTDALAHFVDRETVKKGTCNNCDQSVEIYKRITLHELSPILIINFKRSAASFDSTEKLLHQVNYNELLDVSPYMTSYFTTSNKENTKINSSKNYFYKLYAVINHIGDNLRSGHYYSYIRSSDNLWFLVDDAHCRNVSSNEVFNHPEALVLFYAQAFHTSTNNKPIFQQQQQPPMTLPTKNINPVSYPSIFNSSV